MNQGFKCCTNNCTKSPLPEDEGKYGIENNEWCGLSEGITCKDDTTTTTTAKSTPTNVRIKFLNIIVILK